MKIANPIFALLISTLVLSAPAASGEDEINLDLLTPHGSELDINNVDEALIGTWIMVKGQVETGAGTLPMKAAGRTLSILNSGSFQEDFATEASGPQPGDLFVGQVFGAGIDRYAPRATCQIRANGLSVGHMTQHEELNLDADPPFVDAMTMKVILNKAASTPLEVRCHDSAQKIGNMVTPPLGYGFTRMDGSGPYVEYYYKVAPLLDPATMEVISNWHGLEIWSTPSVAPTARYYFVRAPI